MKLFKFIIFTIIGLFVFSVFVTCVYAGGFYNAVQQAVGYTVSCCAGLSALAFGIVGIYEYFTGDKSDGNRQEKQ